MRKRIAKKLHHLIRNYAYKTAGKNTDPDDMDWVHQTTVEKCDLERIPIEADLATNLKRLKGIYGVCPDFIIRQFEIGGGIAEAAVIFLEGMVERVLLNENLLKPLMIHYRPFQPAQNSFLDQILRVALPVDVVRECVNLHDVIDHVLEGSVVLLVDGESRGLALEAAGFKSRVPEEPMTEAVVRGPREGFTEALHTNITLLRRRLKTPNLVLESMVLGRISHTQVVTGYVRGLAAPELVAEVKERLQRIDIDGILESNYLEEMLRDHPFSFFPQAITTERPDRVAANLLEGRVAILTENTPFVLIVPGEFVAHMQSPEDFYHHFVLGIFIRLLRWSAVAVSLLLPSVYVAVTSFHQEMIPTRLLLSIVAAREGVPFPAVVEALIMEITFEVLREAGVRLPRAVGQAVSIVGALVIGEAAVTAGVVSPLMVIVVALTGISSFLSPSFDLAISIRILRFPMMFLAGLLGLFGVAAGVLAILIHFAGMRSFGLPYLAGLTPFHPDDWKDAFIRAPIWMMRRRPTELSKSNQKRQVPGLKPEPPDRHPQGGKS
ncbi:MAG: spore germination protein [Desulfitobacteriaceae bacterium]|nr:spore germination protein [Desulfitobacteriaceae bacterium]MDI6913120.1 spore germination protein [Desulfitobacteriaceae bacterium]